MTARAITMKRMSRFGDDLRAESVGVALGLVGAPWIGVSVGSGALGAVGAGAGVGATGAGLGCGLRFGSIRISPWLGLWL